MAADVYEVTRKEMLCRVYSAYAHINILQHQEDPGNVHRASRAIMLLSAFSKNRRAHLIVRTQLCDVFSYGSLFNTSLQHSVSFI